jgi:prepilin-type N-terminal cleavage/methylation domain-containing protein
MRRTDRRGVTLIELMIGTVLAGILGASLLQIFVTQSRFNDRVEQNRSARGVARTAVNFLGAELRMTDAHDGVLLAEPGRLRIRVPYAVGLVCQASSTEITAVFMPVDATLYTMGYTGFAVRNALDGEYTYYMNNTPPTAGTGSLCTGSPGNMTVMTGAVVLRVQGSITTVPAVATPITLIRYIEYAFEPSTAVAGRQGLWRKLLDQSGNPVSGQTEELVAPFDSAARFRFFILNNRVPSDTVPTALADLRGIEIQLAGESERTVRGRTAPEQANLVTSVFFLNRLD